MLCPATNKVDGDLQKLNYSAVEINNFVYQTVHSLILFKFSSYKVGDFNLSYQHVFLL